MTIELYDYQKEAVNKLKTGSILCGGVGSGKSLTSLVYYMENEYPKDLYIITTARKRDTHEWEQELELFNIDPFKWNPTIDSWNNIIKYKNITNSFFIFDEQRVVGSGAWVKSFLKICRGNHWILLSATPGDTWMDYVPIFIANGFYKNRTEFIQRHIVYSNFSKYPKVERYLEIGRLARLKDQVIVNMKYKKKTISHDKIIITDYNKEQFNTIFVKRWNFYENKPVANITELCYLLRKVCNSDLERLEVIGELLEKHSRIIIFYNFNYELDLLLTFGKSLKIPTTQWNGHKHENIPNSESWLYLVQYTAGAEGWNCVETDTIVFYSQSYSYKATIQAAGRIDRLNTLFTDLYYYYLRSDSPIDKSIEKALKNKKNFNESLFIRS